MKYCEETRAMLRAYERETDDRIFELQRQLYEMKKTLFQFELERYFEKRKKEEK